MTKFDFLSDELFPDYWEQYELWLNDDYTDLTWEQHWRAYLDQYDRLMEEDS